MKGIWLVLLVASFLQAGFEPIHTAIMYGKLDTVKQMLSDDEDLLEEPTGSGLTPFHIAIKARNIPIANYLLNHGANINAQDDTGISALHLAVKKKRIALVRYLVQHDANLNIQNESGITPLHQAAFSGLLTIVEYLVDVGAEPLLTNNNGSTPYDLAMAKNNKLVANFLRYYNKK